MVTNLTQEPRFARTSFILMGPQQYRRSAFELGADDFIITPPDVIELRKRIRLYLDRADLEERVIAETRITQEMETLGRILQGDEEDSIAGPMDEESVSLLEHAAQLTRERNLLDMILRNAGEPIYLVDPNGVLRYANPAWQRLMGRGAGNLIGEKIPWPPKSESAATNRAIKHALEHKLAWHGDVQLALPNGRHAAGTMTLTPVFDATRELVGYVVMQIDVTNRKALDDLKTRFLSDAAFELRTPVTNIKMRQYLLRQAPPEQHDMHLKALERETERLSQMVDAMLELSRLDAGLVEIEPAETDLARLLADAVVRFSAMAEEKGVTLALTTTERITALHVDTALIARATGILMENAIQHTPEAGHISVALERETWTGGEYATIQIKDTGTGIAPDALPYVFDRFYRTDRARDSGLRGVGLGLAIAREIVTRHNGEITAESQVNHGSTFTIWLPLTPP